MDFIEGVATLIVDTYTQQMQEHYETPDISPPPALEDIVDAHATQYGLQSDDADLLEATAAELRRREQYTAADTVAGWKRTIYAVEG